MTFFKDMNAKYIYIYNGMKKKVMQENVYVKSILEEKFLISSLLPWKKKVSSWKINCMTFVAYKF